MVFACFGRAKSEAQTDEPTLATTSPSSEPLKKDATSTPPSTASTSACIFCNIPPSTVASTFHIVLESDEFVAFHDRSPQARVHLLTVPRQHVGNVRNLRSRDTAMVQRMQAFGARALDIACNIDEAHLTTVVTDERTLQDVVTSQRRKSAFHISPFNSVDHLHLHCLQEPATLIGKIKYPIRGPYPHSRPPLIKGWSWAVSAEQTIALRQATRRVRVGAESGFSTVGGQGAREVGGVPGRDYRRGDYPSGTLSS